MLNGEVVGYEVHKDGLIYHYKEKLSTPNPYPIYPRNPLGSGSFMHGTFYIPHDCKDMWTGKLYDDGSEVYENDKVVWRFADLPNAKMRKAVISYNEERFMWCVRYKTKHLDLHNGIGKMPLCDLYVELIKEDPNA
jgi:hypothetical protein